jgi:hypothetical protein
VRIQRVRAKVGDARDHARDRRYSHEKLHARVCAEEEHALFGPDMRAQPDNGFIPSRRHGTLGQRRVGKHVRI